MRSSRRAFTLVEMMIAVAIVGVLAVLAVVGYRKLIGSSKVTEATTTLSSIREREFAIKAETTKYVSASTSLALDTSVGSFAALYPHCAAGKSAPGNFKVAWGGTCTQAPGWS